MKKNTSLYDDEIDLVALIKIIWKGKIKIILITIISFLLGFGYYSTIPIVYLNSLTIEVIDNYELKRLNNIKILINAIEINQLNQLNQTNQLIKINRFNEKNKIILDGYIDELKDYEELLFNLKKTKKIKENISNLKIEDQELALFKYAKLLEFVEPNKNKLLYILNFKWHDPNEARMILKDTLDLALYNLRKKISYELDQSLRFKKLSVINKDIERLSFLKEQSIIAKELEIENNQINLSQRNVSLNINAAGDIAYYLRGYKAIDKEIELIKNREYNNFNYLEQEINEFKLSEYKLLNYNINFMETEAQKNTISFLIISTLLGFIVGLFYVLIFNAIQNHNTKIKSR